MQVLTISEQKREAILGAALREFEANGFRETSMDRVAASAQVSKRTVYNHFASKQALFDAIAARLVEQARHGSDLPYDANAPVEDQLRRIAAQVLDLFTSTAFMTLARVTLIELIRSPELGRETHELFRRSQTGLARWLQAAGDDGRLRVADPVWAADQFLGLIKSFALWPQLLGGQPAPEPAACGRIIDSTVAMFLAAYPPQLP